MFKIQKNVPMPKTARAVYPFEQMDIGDMFFVPAEKEADLNDINNFRKKVSGAASMAGKRINKKFATQIITQDNQLGIGVWRTD